MKSIVHSPHFWKRAGLITGVSLAITCLHFLTPVPYHHWHLVFDRLCYFPIIVAAYWFGFWGGMVTGAFMALMHLSHIWFQWGGDFFSRNFHQTLEVFVHLFLGFVAGILSERFLRASEKLEQSYAELRQKTEQVLKAEEQLRRTERVQALAELSAGIAHEIRTPLASIQGAAEILASGALTPEQRKEFTDILRRETRHLTHVVNGVLDFARPKKETPGDCRLEETIDSVLDLTEQQRRARRIQVIRRYESGLPSVYFDPAQLKQIIANLIANAMQAMPQGGELILTARREGPFVLGIVEDSGPGIPEAIRPRIFDPFFTTRANGTGLGLSIAQKIAHHHGGVILAENRPEGGARFTVQIPRRPEAE